MDICTSYYVNKIKSSWKSEMEVGGYFSDNLEGSSCIIDRHKIE